MNIDLSNLLTERRNPASNNIDTLSTLEMLTVINNEDRRVPEAITPYLPQIAQLVDRVAQAFAEGGRLIYRRRHFWPPRHSGCQRMPADVRHPARTGCRDYRGRP